MIGWGHWLTVSPPQSPHLSLRAEPTRRASASFCGFDLTILGRSGRHQRLEESGRGQRHLLNGAVERLFVGSRRCSKSADLPHELQSRGPDLVVGGRRLEVVQRSDVPAHISWIKLSRSIMFPGRPNSGGRQRAESSKQSPPLTTAILPQSTPVSQNLVK